MEDNKEEIIKVVMRKNDDFIAFFKDGTVVRTFSPVSHIRRGYKIDQILLCDDNRKEIYQKRGDDIRFIQDYCMYITCIPEEFRIIFMDIDSE